MSNSNIIDNESSGSDLEDFFESVEENPDASWSDIQEELRDKNIHEISDMSGSEGGPSTVTPPPITVQEHDHHGPGFGGGVAKPAEFTFPFAAAPAPTAEGKANWDSSADHLKIGDGATTKTLANQTDKLSVFAATTAAELVGVISGGTGPLIRDWDGWQNLSVSTGTYASANTFTIAGDFTAYIKKGTRIKCVNTTTKYFVSATDSTYAAPNTTVTVAVNTDYVVANAAITALQFSYGDPPDYPDWFNYAPTPTGFSAVPTNCLYHFRVNGTTVHLDVVQQTNGTSDANTFTIPLPITARTITNSAWEACLTLTVDNNALKTTPGLALILSGGTAVSLYTDMAAAVWTAANGKRAAFHIFYQF